MTFRRRDTSYRQMQNLGPIRFIAAACLSASALLQAQSRTPRPPASTPASSAPLPAALPSAAAPPAPLTPAQSPARRAEVTYTDNLLKVSAGNSSLNQILREISRQTGIKITGGVADERVFGEYGPAAPSQVLATLLDGTGSNMLLVHSSGAAPLELVLTPRLGGPTPPNPNAHSFDESSDSDDPPVAQPVQPQPPPRGVPFGTRMSIPDQNDQDNSNTPGSQPPATDPNQQQQSPDGVKTPQQIYDQLQRMRQQQPQQQHRRSDAQDICNLPFGTFDKSGEDLPFNDPRRSHHAPRQSLCRDLPCMDTKHAEHRYADPMGHEHPNRQRRQYRTDQHNRRNHNNSCIKMISYRPDHPEEPILRIYCFKFTRNYNDAPVNCYYPSDTLPHSGVAAT